MKSFLTVFVILFTFNLYSQVSTAEYQLKKGESIMYFDSDWNIISNKSNAEFYRIYKLGSDNASVGEVVDYYKSGQIQNIIELAIFIDLNDNNKWIFDGKSVVYYETGEKENEFYYNEGELEGIYKTFYKSGKLKEVDNYKDGVLHGEYNTFYESGKLKQTGEFNNGKRVGLVKDYYKSGKINFIQKYENGITLSEESFYDSGKTKSISLYEDGKLNGTSKTFYESGEVKHVRNYLNGELNGKSFTFFRNGNEAEVAIFKNGELIDINVKDKFGNLIYKSNSVNVDVQVYQPQKGEEDIDSIDNADNVFGILCEGKLFDSRCRKFYVAIEDGIAQYLIREWTTDENNKYDGPVIEYYDNGQVKREVNYSNDKKNGEEIFYDRYGNITNTIVWNNGTRDNWSLDCSTTPCEYTFSSDFTDEATAKSQGWYFFDDDDQTSFIPDSPEEAKGTYYWENKDDKGRINGVTLPIDNTEDFQCTAIVNHWKGVNNQSFGIIVGWKDWDNYVALKITANGFYKAQIVYKGVDVGMQEFEEVGNIFYKPTKLNIVRVNNKLFFSIDKKIVYTSEYASLIGDYSGIYNSGVQAVTYDDFKLVKTASNTVGFPKKKGYSNDNWNGNGSGIIISNDGLIATNYHVIENANSIEVEFLYNEQVESFRAKVVRTDQVNDLAIIKIDDNSFKPIPRIKYNFKTRTSEVGESVFALGYPKALSSMGKDIKFTDGKISAKTGFQGDVTKYQTTTPIQPGNSGGPLFDYKGNLIGINSSKIVSDDVDNVAYTIKSLYLLTLIDSLNENVNLPSDTSLQSLPLTSKIRELSKYVTLIKVR